MEDVLARMLLQIYRSARESPIGEFEEHAFDLTKSILSFEHSFWGGGAVLASGLETHHAHQYREPEELLIEYEEFKHLDVAAFETFKYRGQTLNFHMPSLFRDKNKIGIRDFVKRFDVQNALCTADRARADFVQWIVLYRADPDHHFSEHERQLCQTLIPHLMEALTINRAIHLDNIGLEKRRYIRGFADVKGVLWFAEPGLEELLHSEWPTLSVKLLPYPLFDTFITKGQRHFRGKAIVVHGAWQKGLLFIGARKRYPADDLSVREREVAALIGAGLTYKEIARQLNIALTTARNHTQAIYDRLGVRNKAELIFQLSLVSH